MTSAGVRTLPEAALADPLAPSGAVQGPAAIVRDAARDLLRQRRLLREEACRLEAALRDHDWPAVRALMELALLRRPEPPTLRPAAPAAPDAPAQGPGPAAAGVREAARAGGARAPAAPAASAVEGGTELVAGLLRLVLRVCEALPQLTPEDAGFAARFEAIHAMLCAPLSPARLAEVDKLVAMLIEEQLEMHRDLQDARSSLKDMLSLLVERLGAVGTSTSRFQQQVRGYREELGGKPDAAVVLRVVGGLLTDTQQVYDEIQKSQEELAEARRKVESYELRVRSLEHELAQTSRMVQNDPLTHALNRRGLDEVFRIETSRAARYKVPLTVVMIDLDDFKRVNDSLGHAAGDRALVHFVTTAQASLRSTEQIARTGGEEFVVIFPATGTDDAIAAIGRLQRALSRSAFAFEGQNVSMTFSGGAASWREGESLAQILRRADLAMYEAKRAGKDRVVTAA